jgi:hypothetical protein
LNGGIAYDEVPENNVSFDPRVDNDSVRVPDDDVVDNDVVVRRQPPIQEQTNPEVAALGCIAVSTCPVPTEPVAV